MDQTAVIVALSNQVNVVLRLAAAAYDQTTLLKNALLALADATPMTDEQLARLRGLLQDVQGAEQEASHAIKLMLADRRRDGGPG